MLAVCNYRVSITVDIKTTSGGMRDRVATLVVSKGVDPVSIAVMDLGIATRRKKRGSHDQVGGNLDQLFGWSKLANSH